MFVSTGKNNGAAKQASLWNKAGTPDSKCDETPSTSSPEVSPPPPLGHYSHRFQTPPSCGKQNRLTIPSGTAHDGVPPPPPPPFPPAPPRTPLQRKDHIVKCPLSKNSNDRSSIRRKTIKSITSSGSGVSNKSSRTDSKQASHHAKNSTDATPVSTAPSKRKPRLQRLLPHKRRICIFFVTALLSMSCGAIGFFAVGRYYAEFKSRREEQLRQVVREAELEPLLQQYQVQIHALQQEQKSLRKRLEQSEMDRATMIETSERAAQELHRYMPQQNHQRNPVASATAKSLRGSPIVSISSTDTSSDPTIAQGIRQLSRQMLLEKYGAGPYHVEFQLGFPGEEAATIDGNDTDSSAPVSSILLELATAEEMPHTVYTFLSRVAKGLYDGCSFYENTNGHTLVAGALNNLRTPINVNLRQRFVDAGLDKIFIREESEAWSSGEWTVGLDDSMSGIGVYINTSHGKEDPASGVHHLEQQKDNFSTQNDTCFAKVVQGFEALRRMQSNSGRFSVPARIAILSARIVD